MDVTVKVAAPVAKGTKRTEIPAPSALLISSKIDVSLWSSVVDLPPLRKLDLPEVPRSPLPDPRNVSARNQMDAAQPSDLNGQPDLHWEEQRSCYQGSVVLRGISHFLD